MGLSTLAHTAEGNTETLLEDKDVITRNKNNGILRKRLHPAQQNKEDLGKYTKDRKEKTKIINNKDSHRGYRGKTDFK